MRTEDIIVRNVYNVSQQDNVNSPAHISERTAEWRKARDVHMGIIPNLGGQIALRKPLVWTRILAPKVALSPSSGYSPGDT
jgi:hypothetical protein